MSQQTSKKSKKQKKGRTEPEVNRFPKKIRKRRQMPRGPHGGMQLILIEPVLDLGQQGDLVEVKPGYGRNYLIPQGMATYVTPEALLRIEKHKAKVEALRLARVADLQVLAKKLEKVSVTIEANANEEGHLYGSVTATDIVDALKKEKFEITADQVRLEGPLKELGLYNVALQLAGEVTSEVKVWVVPNNAEAPTA
ncbi:50S ribosomal protein L9 [Planctomycetes bacterium Pan216]|uniref:Large ribosomal subunit protein bL9 n=1 Tax=Kolteria novifilia TaxID=2527975 RepID=A0A518B9V9_9BACT|nr:50S ribosomal protein L9 [Planctomycetes bacterium Pan216]